MDRIFSEIISQNARPASRSPIRDWCVHYQPRVSLESGRWVGAEALLRPKINRGISIEGSVRELERSGDINTVGTMVLRESCRLASRMRHHGLPGRVSVNVSSEQTHGVRFVDMIQRVLRETGADASAIELEFSERSPLHGSPKLPELFKQLRDMGLRVALDDFGSGHTRFSQVLELPCDVVKLDRRLVRCIDSSARSNRYLRSIVECFSALGATTVAEGVETLGQFEFLQRIGCHQGQGYLWAAAMDDNTFLDGLRRRCA